MTPLDVSSNDKSIILHTLDSLLSVGECLEWGSGGSTLEFPSHIASRPYRYLSMEHSEDWFQRVSKATAHLNVQVKLFTPMDYYVSYPLSVGRRFNFVFVDGRCRRRCLIVASKLLAVGGVVVLHDAEREWYHSAFENFTRHERVGDKLWRGWVDA